MSKDPASVRCPKCQAWEGHHSKGCPDRPEGQPCPVEGCSR